MAIDPIGDEMLQEELNQLYREVLLSFKPLAVPKFKQIPGCPEIKSRVSPNGFHRMPPAE